MFNLDIVALEDIICKEAISEHILTLFLWTDMANPDELTSGMQQAFDRHKNVDCLINNAAICKCAKNCNIL
jgi:NADP-dependent 3-hydroxy acid dehydrogenase YdfG